MMKKVMAILLAVSMLACFGTVASGAERVDYVITNPYQAVDWSTWGQYNADLHCHTIASDGTTDFNEMVMRHYDMGFDVLAVTDHNTISYSWTEQNIVPVVKFAGMMSRKIYKMPTMLSQQEYEDIHNGVGRDGRGMLRVPNGVELNTLGLSNHINAFFTDYGNGAQGVYGDYETPVNKVEQSGGLTVINHPGEYTGAKEYDDNGEKTYGNGRYADKFAKLFLNYNTCLGIDINSKEDGRTKNDRVLWDQVLQRTIPHGRNVFCLATSDAHNVNVVGCGWTVMCMRENTIENFRNCMETGAFFAASRFDKNISEVARLSEELGRDLGTTFEAKEDAPAPKVNNITVNNTLDTITIQTENSEIIEWIADGKVIATGSTIYLDDYSQEIGSYVRAQVFGEGGILYTQAFPLSYDGAPAASEIPEVHDGSKLLRQVADFIYNILSKSYLFSWIVNVLQGW